MVDKESKHLNLKDPLSGTIFFTWLQLAHYSNLASFFLICPCLSSMVCLVPDSFKDCSHIFHRAGCHRRDSPA